MSHRPRLGVCIREVVFGVEDGVVQNMTLVAGMGGAGLSNQIICIAAAINAVAGVLSMSMGTYLSSKAERDVMTAHGVGSGGIAAHDSPLRDAAVMAAAYAGGALVPLFPFLFSGLGRPLTLAAAVLFTGCTLFLLGVGKASVSRQPRLRSGAEMLALASGAGLAGFLLGLAARAVFDLPV